MKIVRFSIKRDFTAILMLERELFHEPMGRMLMSHLLRQYGDQFWFVSDVDNDGIVDTYVLAGIDKPHTLHIFSIAVRKKYQRMGYAYQILSYLINEAIKTNDMYKIKKIVLEVKMQNKRALQLYQSLGWVIIGREENYYDDGSTALKMSYEL